MPPHRKPACAHVHKTYAVLLVFAVGHRLDSESPLFEPSLEEVVQKAEITRINEFFERYCSTANSQKTF